MGATLIVDDPDLAPVLCNTHLLASEGWTTEEKGRSVGMMGNRARLAGMVAQ